MKCQPPASAPKAALCVATMMAAMVCSANATVINFTPLRALSSTEKVFASFAVDPITGKVYERHGGYYDTYHNVNVYADMASFAANTNATTTILDPAYFGTYIAVNDGKLYGRTSSNTTAAAVWDMSTGTKTATVSGFAGMGGANGEDTFDWGGFSGVNFMQDSTGMYVVGGVGGQINPGSGWVNNDDWQINRLGTGLTSVATTVFTPPPNVDGELTGSGPGYAFIINGTLFMGRDAHSVALTKAVDVDTGLSETVDYTLTGFVLNGRSVLPNLSDMTYDYRSDTLYAYDNLSSTFYGAANASAQFGVALPPTAPVPEPASFAMYGLGLVAIYFSRKWHPSRSGAYKVL